MTQTLRTQLKTQQQTLHQQHKMATTLQKEHLQTIRQSIQERITNEEQGGLEMVNVERVKLNVARAGGSKGEMDIRNESLIRIERLQSETEYKVQQSHDRVVSMFLLSIIRIYAFTFIVIIIAVILIHVYIYHRYYLIPPNGFNIYYIN